MADGDSKSGNLIDLASTTVDAVIQPSNGKNQSDEDDEYKLKQRNKTLQLEVDLLTQENETESYKSAVWSLGAGFYGTLLLSQMKDVDRDFLLNVVTEYREVKKEQMLEKWVQSAIKTTQNLKLGLR